MVLRTWYAACMARYAMVGQKSQAGISIVELSSSILLRFCFLNAVPEHPLPVRIGWASVPPEMARILVFMGAQFWVSFYNTAQSVRPEFQFILDIVEQCAVMCKCYDTTTIEHFC